MRLFYPQLNAVKLCFLLLPSLIHGGCAHHPPQPPTIINQAQAALEHARRSLAGQQAPGQLERATVTFARAQEACRQKGDRRSCHDLAYVAQRQAQVAMALAGHHEAQAHHSRALAVYAHKQHRAPQEAARQLVHSRHKQTQDQVEVEQDLASLGSQLPWRHDHTHGLVLAVPQNHLFAHDDTHTCASAQAQLDQMAASLRGAQVPHVRIHSAGPAHLTAARAQHLRQALIDRGVHEATVEVAQRDAANTGLMAPDTWHLVVRRTQRLTK